MLVLIKVLELGHGIPTKTSTLGAWKIQPLGRVIFDKPLPKEGAQSDK
jgi:hypothetical protein